MESSILPFEVVLHLNHYLEVLAQYESWIYLILSCVIFAETGFVVTPFLPSDPLLPFQRLRQIFACILLLLALKKLAGILSSLYTFPH